MPSWLLGGAGHAQEPAIPAKTWEIPVGGNAWITKNPVGDNSRDGGAPGILTKEEAVTSLWFRADRPAELELALRAKVPQGESRVRVSAAGRTFEAELKNPEITEVPLGRISVKEAGYVKVDFQGLAKSGPVFAELEALTVKGLGAVGLDYVKDNVERRFYWGRRGPSVHLRYILPKDAKTEFFYSEITVPIGSDPIGSYYMTNGFGEGYFGMQVNGKDERRILFSVWSPHVTDNPKEIPGEKKITLLKKGEGVHAGEFGGEGSGGQSYWLHPWKAGETYRFLNRARPDGSGSTIYTGWFFHPEKKTWQLIASFKRPMTETYLTGCHSFLENFSDRMGYLGRAALHGNQWACDTSGTWNEVTEAQFTGDDIARRRYRLDFAGGVRDGKFFMRNGGFFTESVKLGTRFTRQPTGRKPDIDLKSLDGY